MVFGVQKGGFYIAKVWFLFFECCVVAIRQQHYWQAVSSCRGRFIVPHIGIHPQNDERKHVCGEMDTRI